MCFYFCFIQDCSELKSGEVTNMLRSKGRNKLFDEKGVFGRVCRHEYPKEFISIKHGERLLDVIMCSVYLLYAIFHAVASLVKILMMLKYSHNDI